MLTSAVSKALMVAKNNTIKLRARLQPQLNRINARLPGLAQSGKAKIAPWLAAAGLVLVALLWSYWRGVVELWQMWQRSDEYSSGLLVPFLAVYILWSRHNDLAQCRIRPSLWGILFFVGAQAVRLSGLALIYSSAENLSIALSVAALVLLLFGWPLLRRVSTVLLFLCLMLPWPNRIQAAIALPLQEWATSSAVFCLETMGTNVMQEGNLIHIGNASVGVAEACNGLRMITAFFVISGLVVLLVKRTWWEKLIVFASSLPVALLCNTTRLAITALAFTVVSGEYWEKVFHDFGGYAMMPLALATVVAELWILAKLTMPPTQKEAIIAVRRK
jgi:exosortase